MGRAPMAQPPGSETRAWPQRATSGPEDQRRGAHGLDQFVRGFGSGERGAVDGGAVVGASVAEFDFGAHGGEQVARGLDVADLGNIFEDDGLVGEQGGGHAGQRGIFRAADADGAQQRLSAADDELVHREMSPYRALLF